MDFSSLLFMRSISHLAHVGPSTLRQVGGTSCRKMYASRYLHIRRPAYSVTALSVRHCAWPNALAALAGLRKGHVPGLHRPPWWEAACPASSLPLLPSPWASPSFRSDTLLPAADSNE